MRPHHALLACLVLLLLAPASPTRADTQDDADRVSSLVARDKDRILQLGKLAGDAPAGKPFRRVDGATGYASVIMPARDAAYSLPELALAFPESFGVEPDGVFLVMDDLIVGDGAELRVDSDAVRDVRLLSRPDRFVTITSWRGSIVVAGQPWSRIRITSWDPATAAADQVLSDGRAWVHTRRGSMSLDWADMVDLGFATGTLSGVSWDGRTDDRVRGDVTGSSFRRNYFGAYTFEAFEMRWRLNTFADNVGYGFDPHDHSDGFLVEFNQAYGNGTHGIIFSRGCKDNVIRYNRSFDNGMHGIVLDDGPDRDADGQLRERQGIDSDDNTIVGNIVTGNEVGIVLDGGKGNVLTGNVVVGNRYGIRMKDTVNGNTITSNRIVDNAEFGIYLYNGSNDNQIVGNVVQGGKSGIVVKGSTGTRIEANRLSRFTNQGISLADDVGGTALTNNEIEDVATGISLARVTDPNLVLQEGNQVRGERRGSSPDSILDPLGKWAFWAMVLAIPVLLGPWFGRAAGGIRRLRPRVPSSA